MYSLLLAIIYLAFISLGLPDSILGSCWPVMHTELNVPVSYMGIITILASGCTIISSLVSNKLTRKFKTPLVTLVSVIIISIGLYGFSISTNFWMLMLFAIPYGLGGGSIDAALNNYVALYYNSKHMSWLHCFWGVGTIISPFVMSYTLTNSSWQAGYRVIAFVQLGIALILFVTLPLWKVNQTSAQASTDERNVGIIDALKIKGVPFLLLGFFAYCAAEATAMSWASTYFVHVKNINEEKAAAYASLFFIGLTTGRFLGGFIMDKLSDREMILLGTGIAACGVISLLLPFSSTVALIAFVLIGFGFAPIYPCIIHSTPANFGAENSGAIIGIQMASAYIGSTFVPPLYGVLGKAIGFGIMPLFLILFILLMVIMIEKTYRLTTKK